ncbi:MAG: MFS transporter [Wolinella sp.]
MKNFTLFVIIYVTIVTLSLMYITQPLQPLFSLEFDVPISKASLLTSIILLPLALAPIFYGYLLEKSSPKRILIFTLTTIGVLQLLLSFVDSYEPFLAIRFLQALLLPAVLTTILTVLTRIDQQNIQKYVSIYVASTVVGGFVGRVFGGYIATEYSWQTAFLILGFSTLFGALLISRLQSQSRVNIVKLMPRDIIAHLQDRRYALLFFTAFVIFFSFQAVLNFLPFRAKEIDPEITESMIGLLYIGYIIGVIVSLLATRITILIGGKERAITFGLLIFAFSTTMMIYESMSLLFGSIFVLCAGMFISHSILSSLTNSITPEKKGIVNGLYLAFYYAGGTIGSIAPGVVYKHFGWSAFVLCIGAILLFSAVLFFRFQKLFRAGV